MTMIQQTGETTLACVECGWEWDGKAWGEAILSIEMDRASRGHIRWAHTEHEPITAENSMTRPSSDGWTGD